jgi:medium-chain acyl-[acyl-carrier-protein] hydrolase
MKIKTDAWFQQNRTDQSIKLKIFCFPYAGGTTQIFNKWADMLPSAVQVIPVELPGRGTRLKETPYVSASALIEDLVEAIRPLLDRPYLFFGHSMGAILAFELARELRRKFDSLPRGLIVSGRRAPQIPNDEPLTYNLPKAEFIEELIKLDGTPREVIEHSELMEIMIPLLRADFQLVQTYRYTAGEPLNCPLFVYGGLRDPHIPRERLLPWKDVAGSDFKLHMLPGDHFFIRSSQAQLLALLTRDIHELLAHSSVASSPDFQPRF